MESPPTISSPPPGWQTLAWFGFALHVPRDWNVTFQRGDNKAGTIGLADLRQMRLEVRWRGFRPRQAVRQRERLIRKLRRRDTAVTELPHALPSFRIQTDQGALVLIQGWRRLYEINWPAQPEAVPVIAASFRDFVPERLWPWAVYGAGGWVPANYWLRQANLLPGSVRLGFRRFRRRLTLGSFSMADRLLADQSLREFAAQRIPLIGKHPAGTWESVADAARFQWPHRAGVLRWRTLDALTLRHDEANNTIQWIHTSAPAGRNAAAYEAMFLAS